MPDAGKTAKVFFYFAQPDVAELLSFPLGNQFHCEVKSFSTPETAVRALQEERPDLLVVDGSREESGVILEAAQRSHTKVAVHHPKKSPPTVAGLDLAGVFSEPELLPGLTEALKQMGFAAKESAKTEQSPASPYFRVGVSLLLRTDPLVSDVFIRLSELKYVKLFHEGTPFGPDDVKKYQDGKKIEYFYVRQEAAELLTAKFNETIEELLRQRDLPQEVSTSVSIATIDTLHSLVHQVGFTAGVQRMVKNEVDLVLNEMYASPSLGGILQNINMDRHKYIASHSHMLAEVACALSIAMKWDSDTSFKKLTMAALLHDMSLSNQKLARVKNLDELNERRLEFTASELDDYRSHTRRASVLIKGLKEVPADVDKIIQQHHELPFGTGFPEQLNHVHIHPLASLIMVGHDLVDWVIDRPGQDPNVLGFIEAYADKYKIGNFRKILKGLYSLQD